MTSSDNWQPGAQGVFLGLEAAKYHAAPGFSHSASKNLEPPAELPYYLTHREEPSVEMILGTLCHQAILEPNLEPPQVAIHPETYVGRDKKGNLVDKDWTYKADYCCAWRDAELEKGKIVLSKKQWENVQGMIQAVTANEAPEMREFLRAVFSRGESEVSVFHDAEVDILPGVTKTILRKARFDFLPVGNFLADIKTVPKGGARKREFQRKLATEECGGMGYCVQAASYLSIARDAGIAGKVNFLFVVIEREAPYHVATYVLEHDSDALRLGLAEWERRLVTYARCCHENQWPGFEAGFVALDLDPWHAKKIENALD